ncbi:MAG: PAC2 family protein [Ilumatobacteraceae bacterium]|jgi:predicted ATP-grasp superfamily ATP-dependent carboligase|nr:PAC2 family protein [Ilumatobacteraceae bacterium]
MNSNTGLPFIVHGQLPPLKEPSLVVMLNGWIDASGAAAAAMETLVEATDSEILITFDSDTFIDYRARRPVMELRAGVNTRVNWVTPELRVGRDREGTDVLLLVGPEPDSNWKFFATTVAELASQLGVRRMVGLGAYPYAAPHTRPVGVSITTPDANVADRLSLAKNTVDVPAGVESVLEHALFDRGTEVIGLWAQVPHYIASMAYPAASAALLTQLCDISGLKVDVSPLRREATIQRERLDQLIVNNEEHLAMLHQMEAMYDSQNGAVSNSGEAPLTPGELPSMEELAAEVEQFLRDQT